MDIILDTNIIVRSGFLLRSRPFQLLFDFIEKTKSQLVMTQLVWEELLPLYGNEIEQRQTNLVTARRRLANMLLEKIDESQENDVDVKLVMEKYKDFLKERMHFSETDIVPYHDHYLGQLVPRAINRRKPFTEKGEEFRDAVLWLTVLDIAGSKETRTVVFISENIRQYAADSHEKKSREIQGVTRIHPDLLQEASGREINVLYYPSVDSFLKSHSATVEYVTKDWLISQLNQPEIEDDLVDMINEYGGDDIKDQLWDSEREIIRCGVHEAQVADINDFFVYETSGGSYFVVAIVLFHIRGCCDCEQGIETPWKFESYSEDFEAEVKVTLSVILRDESINKVHIESWGILNF